MELDELKKEMRSELREWGWLAQMGEDDLAYYHQQGFDRERRKPWKISESHTISMTDERFMEIDKAASKFDPELRKVFNLYFKCGANYDDIAEMNNMNRNRAVKLIAHTISYMLGCVGPSTN